MASKPAALSVEGVGGKTSDNGGGSKVSSPSSKQADRGDEPSGGGAAEEQGARGGGVAAGGGDTRDVPCCPMNLIVAHANVTVRQCGYVHGDACLPATCSVDLIRDTSKAPHIRPSKYGCFKTPPPPPPASSLASPPRARSAGGFRC